METYSKKHRASCDMLAELAAIGNSACQEAVITDPNIDASETSHQRIIFLYALLIPLSDMRLWTC